MANVDNADISPAIKAASMPNVIMVIVIRMIPEYSSLS